MLSNVEVAVIVTEVSSSTSAPTVTRPVGETVTPSVSDVQITVCGAKFAVTTATESWSVVPASTVAESGDTVTDVMEGDAGTNTVAFAKGETLNVFHT